MIGILGGIFDPPHNGHLELAHSAIRRLGLTRLVVLVADRPGHKPVDLAAPVRLRLVQAAFEDVPGAEIVLDEHAFTIDAVADGSFDGAYFVVGADQLADFLTWKDPERVLEHVRLAVGTRPGYPRELLDAVLARLARPDRVVLFELEHPAAVSSTEIRARARGGQSLDGLVPPEVGALIWELGLYAP